MNHLKRHFFCLISLLSVFLVLFLLFQNSYAQENGLEKDPIYQIYPTQINPLEEQTQVPVNTPVFVAFETPMDIILLDFVLYNDSQNSSIVNGQSIWDEDMLSLSFLPEDLLLYNTRHTAHLNLKAYDPDGLLVQSQHQWSFTTQIFPWINRYNINGMELSQHNVQAILGVDNGDVWVSLSEDPFFNAGGLFRFDGAQWHEITGMLGTINAMAQDSSGGIWFATEPNIDNANGGVFYYKDNQWSQFNNLNSNLPENIITCITIDSEERVWVGWGGLFSAGVSYFNGSSWINFNISDNWVTAILADDENRIWIATQFNEIFRIDPPYNASPAPLSSQINMELALDAFSTSALAEGPDFIWLATNQGLLGYNKSSGQWRLYNSQMGCLPNDFCSSVLWNPYCETLFVGTPDNMVIYDGQNWHAIPMEPAGPEVKELGFDIFGHTWVGTNNSLSRFNATAPALDDFIPEDMQDDVIITKKVVLYFSEPMDPDSVINALAFSPAFGYTHSWNTYRTQLNITPSNGLRYNTQYTATLDKKAKDIFGYPLSNDYHWSFKTEKQKTSPSSSYNISYLNNTVYNYNLGYNLSFDSIRSSNSNMLPGNLSNALNTANQFTPPNTTPNTFNFNSVSVFSTSSLNPGLNFSTSPGSGFNFSASPGGSGFNFLNQTNIFNNSFPQGSFSGIPQNNTSFMPVNTFNAFKAFSTTISISNFNALSNNTFSFNNTGSTFNNLTGLGGINIISRSNSFIPYNY